MAKSKLDTASVDAPYLPEDEVEGAASPAESLVEGAVAEPVAESSGQLIRAVYGLMVDPHTGLRYEQKPSELLKMTGWVQSQLDAGKLELV